MSREVKPRGGQKGWRSTPVRVTGAVAFVAALLYWEQTAVLYVLSTLAMCWLLLVVAFSDLEGREKELAQETREQQTAAAGGAEMATAAAPRPQRRVAKRRRHEAA